MKILITGGSGLLGQYLNIYLSQEFEILTLYNNNSGNCGNYNSAKIDINNHEKLEELITNFLPEVIIHLASISTPQLAASLPPKIVYLSNVKTTKKIAEISDRINAKLIFTSTDLVYAGYRGSMLKEDAKLIPVSLYAETKLMGEEKIKETFDNFLILRMALMFGFGLNHAKTHFDHIYLNLKENKKVKLFYDQYRTPLSLIEAANIIKYLVKNDIKKEIINVGGKDRLTRVELGEKLCEKTGFNKNLIEKISMKDIPGFPQVADVSMNTDKLQSYGIKLKNFEESLEEILNKKF